MLTASEKEVVRQRHLRDIILLILYLCYTLFQEQHKVVLKMNGNAGRESVEGKADILDFQCIVCYVQRGEENLKHLQEEKEEKEEKAVVKDVEEEE